MCDDNSVRDSSQIDCPECGRQLHRLPMNNNLLKCFNGPKFWKEGINGELVNVTEEVLSS